MGIIILAILNVISLFHLKIEIWLVGMVIIAIGELYFIFVDKKKPLTNDNKLRFTTKRKARSLVISAIITSQILGGYKTVLNTIDFLNINIQTLISIGWIFLMIFGVFGIGVGYVYLNSLKYKRGK